MHLAPGRAAGLVLLSAVLLISACSIGGGGDDDDVPVGADDGTVTATAQGLRADGNTATVSQVEGSPTTDASPEATGTLGSRPTATPKASPTATEEPVDLAAIAPLDPNVMPNFSLTMTMTLEGNPNGEDVHSELEVRQAAPDNYYLRFVATDTTVESWLVGGSSYLRQADGTIVQVPGGVDAGLVSPSMFLTTVPAFEQQLKAFDEGTETVSARETTRYRIEGEELLALSGFLGADADVSNVDGEAEIWVDKELGILIKQVADITWVNRGGGDGSLIYDYLLDAIGSTGTIQPPQ